MSISLTRLSAWVAAVMVAFALTTAAVTGEAQAKSIGGKAKIVDGRFNISPGLVIRMLP
jgi:hypothetical protein